MVEELSDECPSVEVRISFCLELLVFLLEFNEGTRTYGDEDALACCRSDVVVAARESTIYGLRVSVHCTLNRGFDGSNDLLF